VGQVADLPGFLMADWQSAPLNTPLDNTGAIV
jgi:hypothetical protein